MKPSLAEIVQKMQGSVRTDDELLAYELGYSHGYDMAPAETELMPASVQEAYNEGYERGYSKAGPHI